MSTVKVNRMSSFGSLRKSFRKSALQQGSSLPEWTVLPVVIDGKKAALRFSSTGFQVNGKARERVLETAILETPVQRVLYAQLTESVVVVSALARKAGVLTLVKVEATVDQTAVEAGVDAAEWVKGLMRAAYGDVKPRRSFMIVVNPVGGPGKARTIFEHRLRPILEAAHCTIEVVYTTHYGHAKEIALTLPLVYDAVLAVSGDGLPYEIINGFAQRLDAREALERTPIVQIPAGSGNGFSINLLGVVDGMDPVMGVLNALKGTTMSLDLASITMLDTRETTYSFLAQAAGLMAELDLGTENLRWMGDARFIIGFLKGVWNNSPRELRITIRNPENDKAKLLDTFAKNTSAEPNSTDGTTTPNRMPLPEYIDEDDKSESWTEFKKPVLYAYGGLLPYVARDLMQFPLKRPSDGQLHLVVQEIESRMTMVKLIDGGKVGEPFFLKTQRYYTTQAYRITPAGPASTDRACFAMDGERIPYAGFHAEVHPGVLKTLSIYGKFMSPSDFGAGRTPPTE